MYTQDFPKVVFLVDRLLCGVSITDDDIAQMGVGGLVSPEA